MVDAVRSALDVQHAMIARNAACRNSRIEFRVGIHLGDVVEESDADLMGDGVNIAARLELSPNPERSVFPRTPIARSKDGSISPDYLGEQLKNIAEPVRAYSLEVGVPAAAKPAALGAAAAQKKRPSRALLGLAGAVVLIALAAVAWRYLGVDHGAPQFASVDHARSIVVLPLSNLSGDASQDYLADALTSDPSPRSRGCPACSSSRATRPSPTAESQSTSRPSAKSSA